jgi:glycosyl-4,4'-diaponeurosporenoate acyltransferase
MPLIELPLIWVVFVDCLAWAVASVTVGYIAHRWPLRRLEREGPLTRLRGFERDGRWYERRLRVKRWKDRLPEAGAFFAGGFSKRSLSRVDGPTLGRFIAETRRAELTHWALMAVAPVFFLWNPWWLGLVMIAYALIANLPCLVVQRYNRARLVRVRCRVDAVSESRP